MTNNDPAVIARIHASGRHLVLAITGGGSGAISALLQVPGASASILEAAVPYAAKSLEQWLGGRPDQFCSERTARAMAMAAFERARTLSEADPHELRGVGATASLATLRPKRGAHRIHVAWQSPSVTAVVSCELNKGERTRAEEEQIATHMVLEAVAEACGVDASLLDSRIRSHMDRHRFDAPPEWTELLLGQRSALAIPQREEVLSPKILFPGAFNPLHWGHERMAELAAARYHAPVTFELSMLNVDKPPLDFMDLADRLKQLTGKKVLVSRAATFVEKARLAPGCVFVVGIDTLRRIAEPRYYDNDPARRDAAIAAFAREGCRFLVFGRKMQERFVTLSETDIPAALYELCDEVPEAEFHADISSTELRDT